MRFFENRTMASWTASSCSSASRRPLCAAADEAVHAIENVDHELVPPAAHLAAVATAPGDDEPAQMLVFVLRNPAGVAAHGHRLTLSQTPAALARLGVGRSAT